MNFNKNNLSLILDFLIILVAVLCLFLLYNSVEIEAWLTAILTVVIVLPVLSLVVYEVISRNKPLQKRKKEKLSISTLILLGEDDRPIKIWDLSGKVGLLIGKSSEEYQVDIDLSNTDYESFIDDEHALLNYTDTGWWVQNVSPRNEMSIKRKGNELLLGTNAPAKLELGDVLHIAHYTRIAVN
jgi:hypothetical protein